MQCEDLWSIYEELDLTFFTGVPDSTFKAWMTFLTHENGNKLTNVIASNECEAVAIASGYHLASSKIGVVYMQNAGEGKTVNPLTSLCDPQIYSIPLVLMIGWRGEPGTEDEPQHWKMGKITTSLLELMDIPYEILPEDLPSSWNVIKKIVTIAKDENRPVALIIRKDKLTRDMDQIDQEAYEEVYELSREEAIQLTLDRLSGSEAIISTTGKTSRELYEYRIARNETPRDFYTVGGMGCVSAIALGATFQQSTRKIVILDGDGSILMQMGSLATIGHYSPKNLYHVVFDNESHDSTGGQPTVSPTVDLAKIALACGYRYAKTITTKKDLTVNIQGLLEQEGPSMLIIKVKKGARIDLGRPTTTPIQNKDTFMEILRD